MRVLRTVEGYHDACGDILSTVGDIMINVGDIMSTVRVILSTVGGYHEYRGGGIMSTVGGYHEHRGGYHEYRGGCSVPWGKTLLLFEYPHGTEHPPRYSWYPPHVSWYPHGTQIIKDGICKKANETGSKYLRQAFLNIRGY